MSKKGKGNFIKFHGASKTAKVASSSARPVKEDSDLSTSLVTSISSASSTSISAKDNTVQSSPSPPQPATTVKRNPEALLDDLSASLSTFSSTVKTWLPVNAPVSSASTSTASVSWHQNGTGREPRLGLGAKPSSSSSSSNNDQSAESAGVFASLQLKKKLTSLEQPKKPFKRPKAAKEEQEEAEEPSKLSSLSQHKKNKL